MSAALEKKMTPQEYLAFERVAEFKHEFVGGEVFAMAGASRYHEAIFMNLSGELRNALKGRVCRPFGSNMRVKVSKDGQYVYPDATIICGKAEFEDKELDTLLNPTVVFEILSKSTEGYDRGLKFELYNQIETICEYVLIAQDRMRVEHFIRQPKGGWLLEAPLGAGETLHLASPEISIPVDELYQGVFDQE